MQPVASSLPLGNRGSNRARLGDTTRNTVATSCQKRISRLTVSIACQTNGVWIDIAIQQHAARTQRTVCSRELTENGRMLRSFKGPSTFAWKGKFYELENDDGP